ncbi:MAG: hypothetical protein KAJ52_00570 [Sedimentisphaerales bacterium]|nr:hypothetical protein [Sedimentisphaerales bacterium]
MSNDYLTILQLTHPVTPDRLDTAYQRSQLRFLRLTRRGPLRFYRNDLLTAVQRAYKALKSSFAPEGSPWMSAARLSARPLSLLARRVADQRQKSDRPPVKSSVKDGLLPFDKTTAGRFGLPPKQPELTSTDRKKQNQVEDQFCREVIYRLEGDLIRFDSRRELLRLADNWNIPLFQANLLIAQIVESVRQNKLYLPSPAERKTRPARSATLTPTPALTLTQSPRLKGLIITIGLTALLAAIANALIIYFLSI